MFAPELFALMWIVMPHVPQELMVSDTAHAPQIGTTVPVVKLVRNRGDPQDYYRRPTYLFGFYPENQPLLKIFRTF